MYGRDHIEGGLEWNQKGGEIGESIVTSLLNYGNGRPTFLLYLGKKEGSTTSSGMSLALSTAKSKRIPVLHSAICLIDDGAIQGYSRVLSRCEFESLGISCSLLLGVC